MREVTASAPGKVNLLLHCGAPTPDGYHGLVTVFEALDLRETVTVRTSRTPGIRVRNRVHLPDGRRDHSLEAELDALPAEVHLAARAARLLQRLAAGGPWGEDAAGLVIEVDKRVPVAGGMAGGSADAAATLVACNELWGLGLDADRLQALGRTLGADVPACLVGGTCLGTGRGDLMTPLRPPRGTPAARHHWVMLRAHGGLSTPEVFRALDAAGGPAGGWSDLATPAGDVLAACTDEAAALARILHNDLEEAALGLRPELARTLEAARGAGALAALVSGSGPTIAVLAADEEHAHRLADLLSAEETVAAAIPTSGPVEGARVEQSEVGR